jgi:hypothetical protein
MNLRENLNEIEIIDSLISDIKRDCKPFINEIGNIGKLLYRGTDKKIKDYAILKSHMTDRKPKNMPLVVHEYLNKKFKKKFGWPVRNGVFVTFDEDTTAHYGGSYIFFPIGTYKYAHSSKVVDLYEDYYGDFSSFRSKTNWKFKLGPEHERKYGSKTGKGTWLYKKKSKNLIVKGNISFFDAAKHFMKVLKNDNYEEIALDIVWMPEVSLDDYIKNFVKKEQDRMYKEFDKIVDSYKTKHLGDHKFVEISFNCDKYYLIDIIYKNDLQNEFLS